MPGSVRATAASIDSATTFRRLSSPAPPLTPARAAKPAPWSGSTSPARRPWTIASRSFQGVNGSMSNGSVIFSRDIVFVSVP